MTLPIFNRKPPPPYASTPFSSTPTNPTLQFWPKNPSIHPYPKKNTFSTFHLSNASTPTPFQNLTERPHPSNNLNPIACIHLQKSPPQEQP